MRVASLKFTRAASAARYHQEKPANRSAAANAQRALRPAVERRRGAADGEAARDLRRLRARDSLLRDAALRVADLSRGDAVVAAAHGTIGGPRGRQVEVSTKERDEKHTAADGCLSLCRACQQVHLDTTGVVWSDTCRAGVAAAAAVLKARAVG